MSMTGYLDESNVINSIRLQLRHPSGAKKIWIIVEGETDQKLFSKLVNGENVEIEISYGGINRLLSTVSELFKETNRIIGIRDADFLHLEKRIEYTKNIFLTDVHDSEMMIISCDNAYHAVVSEYLTEEKEPSLLREKILRSISFIGGIRWINNSYNLELNFKNLGLGNYFDGEHVILDEDNCINEIIKRSPNRRKDISKEEVWFKIKDINDFLNLCNGHDFQKAFALYASYRGKKGIKDIEIGKAFRVAYRFSDFQQTNLYTQLKEWSNAQSRSLFKQAQ